MNLRRRSRGMMLAVLAGLCAACGDRETPAPRSSAAPVEPVQPPPAIVRPVPAPPPRPAVAEDPGWTAVRAYTELFYRGDLEQLHGKFTAEMQGSLSLAQLKALRQKVAEQYGKETRVLGSDFQAREGYRGYVRWVRFEKRDDVIEMLWILRQGDAVAGFFIQPAAKPGSKAPAPR